MLSSCKAALKEAILVAKGSLFGEHWTEKKRFAYVLMLLCLATAILASLFINKDGSIPFTF
ncbi:hypothetical protein NCCP28_24130 [Niallia sp. NCCP-28]|nr:hypothetical protein NCCP28_24130 [Niallia sp. NCCP-28]